MRKLTVVNPDPSDDENEPLAAENLDQTMENSPSPLEERKDDPALTVPPELVPDMPMLSPSDEELETSLDKPLPPRLGTPKRDHGFNPLVRGVHLDAESMMAEEANEFVVLTNIE